MDDGAAHPLPVGKLTPELLAELIGGVPPADSSVVQGPGLGLDAAILDLGADQLLVAKTDPITFATDAIGYYVVAVNSNDIAACGAEPRWMMATVLLPEGASADLARGLFRQVGEACASFGISLAGGHTEVTPAVSQPVIVGMMLATVERGRWVSAAGVQAGDVVLVAGAAGVEGTALLARERPEDLARRGLGADLLAHCAAMLHDPGLSALPQARAAMAAGGVHAMHDPTEGGVATALWEMAAASGRRIVADPAAVPMLPETARVCAEVGIDPLGLLSSGALLIAVAPDAAAAVRGAVEGAGVPCAVVGRAEDGPAAVLRPDGASWARYDQDEITRVL